MFELMRLMRILRDASVRPRPVSERAALTTGRIHSVFESGNRRRVRVHNRRRGPIEGTNRENVVEPGAPPRLGVQWDAAGGGCVANLLVPKPLSNRIRSAAAPDRFCFDAGEAQTLAGCGAGTAWGGVADNNGMGDEGTTKARSAPSGFSNFQNGSACWR